MTAHESKEAGQRLYKAGQYAEAMPLLEVAAEASPKDENLWQELVLAAHYSGQFEKSVEFAKQAVRQHPRSGWLWRELGSQLTSTDRLEEAENALDNARSLLGNGDEWLWRYYAALHKKRENIEKEIEAWENLHAFGEANANDLKLLGTAYYNHKNFGKALEFYRLSAATEPSFDPLFNMGLLFNDPEVSQDADAADAYRRALALMPDQDEFSKTTELRDDKGHTAKDYEDAASRFDEEGDSELAALARDKAVKLKSRASEGRNNRAPSKERLAAAKKRLAATKGKLEPLAERARTEAAGLAQPDELFQFYVNPFEVFQIEESEEPDAKTIQRAKKKLLQEIDVNDGKVSWLNDYPLDKSRALGLEDELHDEKKRGYHWAIFRNKPLLRFLTHGDIGHFLYADDYFPRATLELLDEEPEFRAFLSKPFARQYNVTLTRAIDRRLLSVVEVLFDGRRWVKPEDEDVCFEGAHKRIAELVEAMRSKANDGSKRKVSLSEMEEFLQKNSLPDLFNLLPSPFASSQRDFAAAIRELAISCINKHDDAGLSKGVLNLCKRFTTRSVDLDKRLEEDFKAIERIVAENRAWGKKQLEEDQKYSFSALVHPNAFVRIGKAGISYDSSSMSAAEVEAIRWGASLEQGFLVGTMYSFSLIVRSARWTLSVEWGSGRIFSGAKDFFRKAGERTTIAELSSMEQEAAFQKMIEAAYYHLVNPLVSKILGRLQAGQSVVIGPCTLFQAGIAFRGGGIFSKEHHLPWRDATTRTADGSIYVMSIAKSAVYIAMPAKDSDNAVILPIICEAMRKHSN